MKVIGHRGWPERYPDNSIDGIKAASGVAAMIETDIRRTEGGELVLSHDPIEDPGGLVRLDELLAAFPDFPFNLEIKNFPGEPDFDPDHGSGLETAARARPFDLLTCFFWPTVDEIHRRFPEVSTGLLVDRSWDLTIAIQHARSAGHKTLVPHWSVALEQPQATAAAAEQGLEVAVWTLNDFTLITELANLGVTAIITDDPGAMSAALKDET